MDKALDYIKSKGPIFAKQLGNSLSVSEKQARNLIDKLRASGEPIWFDANRGFWWLDDMAPSGVPYKQWRRTKVG